MPFDDFQYLTWSKLKGAKLPDPWVDRLWLLGLLLAAGLLYSVNLGGVALRDWDEGTVAQVARDMVRAPAHSLTWLYPTIAGEPYFNKPPLLHWLIAIVFRIGGINEWTARLPGATLTALSVPLFYSLGRELVPQRTPVCFAALVYLTFLPVVRHGRLAMLDGAILCFFLLLVFCLLRMRRDLRWGLGVGLAFGLLVLTKGMLALLLGAIALLFTLWDTPRLLTSRYIWLGLLLGSAPGIAWYAAQWWHYGQQFVDTGLLSQSLSRIIVPVEGNKGAPWYYLLEILKYGMPWFVFLPQGFQCAWENRNLGWAKLTITWAGVYLVVISLMSTKLPWYVLPVYPALALVVGMQLAAVWEPRDFSDWRRNRRPYPKLWLILLGLVAIAVWTSSVYFSPFGPLPLPQVPLILVATALMLTVAFLLMWQRDSQFILVLLWGMYVALMLFVSSSYWVWELDEAYPVKPVAAIVQRHTPPGTVIWTSFPDYRPSLNFYSDRQVIPADLDHALIPEKLQAHWHDDRPYLLVQETTLPVLALPSATVLGKAEGWVLVTRSPLTALQPDNRSDLP